MTKHRTAVLISGSGSNFQALAEAARDDLHFPADLCLVISNRPDVQGLERAKSFGIQTIVIDHKAFSGREAFDAELDRVLNEHEIELICLAGFMRILTNEFVTKWSGRMLNIHPSVLPAFPGNRAHEQVLASSTAISGCTVHVVIPAVDAGPIIAQAAVPRLATDDVNSLAARVRSAEHILYPFAVRSFLRDEDHHMPRIPEAREALISVNSRVRLGDTT